jgi:hypothetical protein
MIILASAFAAQGFAAAWAGEIKGEQNIKANANAQTQVNSTNSKQDLKIGTVEGQGKITGKQKINTNANAQTQVNSSNSKQSMEIGSVK